MRDDLKRLFENLIATHGSSNTSFLGSTPYGLLETRTCSSRSPNWESAEARDAHMREAAATGAYAPLLELLAAPFRVMVLSQLT
jgi:hypothetical protein